MAEDETPVEEEEAMAHFLEWKWGRKDGRR